MQPPLSDLGLISVVVPAYNYGRYVRDAVDGALAQTYTGGVEILVVDDGSTDDTRARLAGYGDRIRYIHQRNKGLSGARNTGIKEARGEWIALLDADDVWHPRHLEVLAPLIRKHGLDGLGTTSVNDIAELNRPLPDDPDVCPLSVRDLLTTVSLAPSGTLLRRRELEAVGYFDEALRAVEDRDMWIRLALRCRLGQAWSPSLFYRLHPDQMNQSAERMHSFFLQVLDKFFREHPDQKPLRARAYAFMHVDSAICYLAAGSPKEARRHVLRSLRLLPFEPGLRGKLSSVTRLKILLRALLGEQRFASLRRAGTGS